MVMMALFTWIVCICLVMLVIDYMRGGDGWF